MLTVVAAALLALEGVAGSQTAARAVTGAAGRKASVHGACGPGHPYVQVSGFSSDLRNDGPSVAAAVKAADLVLVGSPSSFRTVVADRRTGGTVRTEATFLEPLILKSPPEGPTNGPKTVRVAFPGGTALVANRCTQDPGPALRKGGLYLVFAAGRPGGGYFSWNAYPIDPSTGKVGSSWRGSFSRRGRRRRIDKMIAEIRAVAARERRKTEGTK